MGVVVIVADVEKEVPVIKHADPGKFAVCGHRRLVYLAATCQQSFCHAFRLLPRASIRPDTDCQCSNQNISRENTGGAPLQNLPFVKRAGSNGGRNKGTARSCGKDFGVERPRSECPD